VYTAPTLAEVNGLLVEAGQKLERSAEKRSRDCTQFSLEERLAFGFEDVDPDGLLSGPFPKLGRRS
jgi:hypothetical protein